MRPILRSIRKSLPVLSVVSVLSIVSIACNDVEAPRPVNPLVGTWELTTVLDTFSFETPAPSLPDCPYHTEYCTHYRTNTAGAGIAGMLEVSEQTPGADPAADLLVEGDLMASFCDVIDYQGLTGCTHVSDSKSVHYTGSISGFTTDSTMGTLHFVIGEPDPTGFGLGQQLRSYAVTVDSDSMYGNIYWGSGGGRSPPTYRGTFVAHRQK